MGVGGDVGEKSGVGGVEVNDVGVFKYGFVIDFCQFILQLLGMQYQWNIFFIFVIGVMDKMVVVVMVVFLVGRLMGIGYQNIEFGMVCIIVSGGVDGVVVNNDKIVLYGEFWVIVLLVG